MSRSDLLDALVRQVPLAVMDLEFTGLHPEGDRICEVAVLRDDGTNVSELHSLVRPDVPMSERARLVHGLSDEELERAPRFEELAESIRTFLQDAVVVCHNVELDLTFLHQAYERMGKPLEPPVTLDTLLLCRRLFAFPKNDLGSACERLGVAPEVAHRALGDARSTHALVRRILEIMDPDHQVSVDELTNLVEALAPNSPLRTRQQQTLRDAFREHRTVLMDYVSTSDPAAGLVRREVGIWHLRLPRLQGWCYLRQGERVFRVDRIRRVQKGDTAYDIPQFKRRI